MKLHKEKLAPRPHAIEGAFSPQLLRKYGKGFVVDRHPVGTYRIELAEKIREVLMVEAGLMRTNQDYQCVVRDIDTGAGTLTIETYKIGRKIKLAWPPPRSQVHFTILYWPQEKKS